MTVAPIVSVLIITYNHEKYVGQAIQGALDQKVNFSFEIVIGDDASSDKTIEICNSYLNKYPDKIKLLTVKENRGPISNLISTLEACQGKFVAICEGDDYWTDPLKLQKQVDVLERHSEYVLCHHAFDILHQGGLIVKKDRNQLNTLKPIIGFEDVLEFPYPKTLTVMFKRDTLISHDLWGYLSNGQIGDIGLWHLILLSGKGYFINEVMGCYRSNPSGVTNNLVANHAVTKAKISILEKLIHANAHPNHSLMREYLSKHYQTLFLNEGSWSYFFRSVINKLRSRYLFTQLEIKNRVTVGSLLVGLRKKLTT